MDSYEYFRSGNNTNTVANRPKTKRGLETFLKLIKAAEDVFGEKGYHAASITAITMKAGIAQGTFYIYFNSKKDIFTELIYFIQHDVKSFIRRHTQGITDRLEAEKQGVIAFYQYILEHRNLYKLLREAEFVDEELYRWYYQAFSDSYAHRLTDSIGKEFDHFDPETLTFCLMGVTIFTGMRWPLWEGRMPPAEAIETVHDFITYGLRGRKKTVKED